MNTFLRLLLLLLLFPVLKNPKPLQHWISLGLRLLKELQETPMRKKGNRFVRSWNCLLFSLLYEFWCTSQDVTITATIDTDVETVRRLHQRIGCFWVHVIVQPVFWGPLGTLEMKYWLTSIFVYLLLRAQFFMKINSIVNAMLIWSPSIFFPFKM